MLGKECTAVNKSIRVFTLKVSRQRALRYHVVDVGIHGGVHLIRVVHEALIDHAIGAADSRLAARPNSLAASERHLVVAVEVAILHHPNFVAVEALDAAAAQLRQSRPNQKLARQVYSSNCIYP